MTVNISFDDSLLEDIDAEARRESRSRSELIREAARGYIRRQRQWNEIFALGEVVRRQEGLTEADVEREVRMVRRRRERA